MKKIDDIILIGSNSIACECAKYLNDINEKFEVIESHKSLISMLSNICKNNDIKYSCIFDDKLLEKYLLDQIKGKRVLIISANNRYIFTKKIVDSKNVVIINFHYSLLPSYRGVNIPTWVIFNNERKTGVTWHYVNENIDDGDIIIQEEFKLFGNETALDITQKGMQIGIKLFKKFIIKLLNNNIEEIKINYKEAGRLYKSNELPQDGFLDLSKNVHQIYSLLRAFDYGILNLIPKLKINIQNKEYIVCGYNYSVNYCNSNKKNTSFDNNKIIINEDKYILTVYLK